MSFRAADEVGARGVDEVLLGADTRRVHHVVALARPREGPAAVDDQPRALQREDPRQLGVEPEVVTDLHADRTEAGREDGQARTRPEQHALEHPGQRAQVHLVVRAEQALGADDRDRVVEDAGILGVAFRETEEHVDVVLAGEVDDVVGRRPGHRLGFLEVLVARVPLGPARVAARRPRERLLGKGDDVDALRRGLDDVGLDLGQRALLVAPDGREVRAPDRHDLLERGVLRRDHRVAHGSPHTFHKLTGSRVHRFTGS